MNEQYSTRTMLTALKCRALEFVDRRSGAPLSHIDRIFPSRFSGRSGPKLALYLEPNRISFSQSYPFIRYSPAFARRFGAELAVRNINRLIDDPGSMSRAVIDGADVILLQTWFRIEPDVLRKLAETLRAAAPHATVAFLDAFAPADLRFAETVDPSVDYYLTKSLLRDPDWYARPTVGDTNLTEHYARAFGIDMPERDWRVPPGFLSKVRLTPNFILSPRLSTFFQGREPIPVDRPIDVHARLESRGSDWYGAMRQQAIDALAAIEGLETRTGVGVDGRTFMTEMRQSKICFSPFGYGELCWRDIEAMATGAVLVKPDMSHLSTDPDLYRPNETYVPVDWSLNDLEDTIRNLLADDARRARLARTAFDQIADYLRHERFVDQMAFLFEGRAGANGLHG